MFKKLSIAIFTLGLAAAVAAAPAGAEPASGAPPSAPIAGSAPGVTNYACNSHATCIYVTHSGYYVNSTQGTGYMVGAGCIQATLRIDGVNVSRTVKKCYSRGTKVVATFSINRSFGSGDNFQVILTGTGHPAGPFPLLYFK